MKFEKHIEVASSDEKVVDVVEVNTCLSRQQVKQTRTKGAVWHKPYGMLSQGSRWGDHRTINRWSEAHLKPQRTVNKGYRAMVKGIFPNTAKSDSDIDRSQRPHQGVGSGALARETNVIG